MTVLIIVLVLGAAGISFAAYKFPKFRAWLLLVLGGWIMAAAAALMWLGEWLAAVGGTPPA